MPSKNVPAVIVIASNNKIRPAHFVHYAQLKEKYSSINGVQPGAGGVIGPIPSKDGLALEYLVQVVNANNLANVINDLKTTTNNSLISPDQGYVTGPAGLAADLFNAFKGIDGILLYVAVGTVFFILLLVYRSLILPFLVLIGAMFALTGAILVVYYLAKNNVIKLNGQSQGILSILVIGASTDYSLLLISRYREALDHHKSKYNAIVRAWKRAFEPILASAATVILALLCLLFSDLNSNKGLGPVAAIGIAFSFLSAMTLLPAFLVLFGRKSFWPFQPKFDGKEELKEPATEYKKGIWTYIPNFIEKKYRLIWIFLLIILIISSLGLFQLKASGITIAQSILGKSSAVTGQNVASEHFPAGAGSPTEIITPLSSSDKVLDIVKANNGVSSAVIYANPINGSPVVSNGNVLINATFNSVSSSAQANNTVLAIRNRLKTIEPNALVGGVTAVSLDTNRTAQSDLRKIVPIVLVVIFIILMLLLRSVMAPFLLVLSVIVSFAASLGLSALVFNHILKFPGSDASVPLFGFIFLVALGIDYNIFLMSRVREESLKTGTKKGILLGLSVTGGVITSAGIVLAATFASLIVIPILFLAQIAFIVAFGVLVDTVIVRSFLVPSASYDIGKLIWWPSKLWSKGKK